MNNLIIEINEYNENIYDVYNEYDEIILSTYNLLEAVDFVSGKSAAKNKEGLSHVA